MTVTTTAKKAPAKPVTPKVTPTAAERLEQAAKRIETLLGDCFEEQRKDYPRGFNQYAPMLYDDRVRAAAHLKPMNIQEAA